MCVVLARKDKRIGAGGGVSRRSTLAEVKRGAGERRERGVREEEAGGGVGHVVLEMRGRVRDAERDCNGAEKPTGLQRDEIRLIVRSEDGDALADEAWKS